MTINVGKCSIEALHARLAILWKRYGWAQMDLGDYARDMDEIDGPICDAMDAINAGYPERLERVKKEIVAEMGPIEYELERRSEVTVTPVRRCVLVYRFRDYVRIDNKWYNTSERHDSRLWERGIE